MNPTPLPRRAIGMSHSETPAQIEAAARLIDPDCKREGNNWVMLKPGSTSGKRHSLRIHCTKGVWKDFSSKVSGSSAASLLTHYKTPQPAGASPAPEKSSTAWPVGPLGDQMPAVDPPKGHKLTRGDCYKNAEGRQIMWVFRFDSLDGTDKTYRPYHWDQGWVAGDPHGLLPMFKLDRLAVDPKAEVLVTEGEKSALSAEKLFKGMVCTTSSHGANSAARTDWSLIKGRAITIWPDHDEPGLGYAQDVAAHAYDAGAASVRIVQVPDYFPTKWDLADKPPIGADLKALLKAAVLVQPPPKPIEMLDPTIWLTYEPPPIRWLLKGLLPHGLPAILAGKSNCGKSLAAMQMSMAVAVGASLFGLETDGVARKVLFVSMEDDSEELHRRFCRCLDLLRQSLLWAPHMESRLLANWRAVVPVWASKELKTLVALTGHLQGFSAQLCEAGEHLGLIVLDTFASLSEGEENKAEAQQAFWAACHQLVESTGATPLVIHHVRKTLSQSPPSMSERLNFENLRGSSAIVGGARAILQMEPLFPSEATKQDLDEDRAIAGNYAILALTKINGGPKGAWMALEQREASDVGAGFFDLMESSDRICAVLRSKATVAKLRQAEGILLAIADKVSREEIAKRYWPDAKDRATKLTKAISALRTRQKWIEKGSDQPTIKGQLVLVKLRQKADITTDISVSTKQDSV